MAAREDIAIYMTVRAWLVMNNDSEQKNFRNLSSPNINQRILSIHK